jgi:Xaa-Pro dipeptidase
MEPDYRSLYAAHVDEIRRRWELALEAESFMAAVVHSGTPMYSFLDDYEYAFRPNPHFLAWLPLTHHADSVLLLAAGQRPILYFHQPDDYWYLPPADPEPWWAEHFDVRVVSDPAAWRATLQKDLPDASLRLGDVAAIGDAPALNEVFDAKWVNPGRLLDRLHLARTRKTPYEVACIDRAARLAAAAHVEAERAFRDGESEFGIHLRYLAACRHTDTQLPYNNIVALNDHGAVLHYQERERAVPDTVHSFLLDAGCTVNAYASDITRTYASADGEFADMIMVMDGVQQELIGRIRAGVDYKELFLQSHLEIAGVLASFGVIKVPADEAFETWLSSVFYPHGLGHFLGLQTHDVAGLIDNHGRDIPKPEGHPALRLTRVLEADNVLTVEPGLYFIPSLLDKWRAEHGPDAIDWDKVERLAPCGGIRIEDNVVVTEDGCSNLTRRAFADLTA